MRAALYFVPGRTHEGHLGAMAMGLARHGIEIVKFSGQPPQNTDFAVVWGERVRSNIKDSYSKPILVMERGFVSDRFFWSSMGWDGLNGRAKFPCIEDPSRWDRHFDHLLRPWRTTSGYALLIGQVPGDMSIRGVKIDEWYQKTARRLFVSGWDVRFRQHPVEVKRQHAPPRLEHVRIIGGDLDEAMAGAGLVVTYNSNTAVDALLCGAPVHAEDAGSMVYDLASHDLSVIRPERLEHFRRMAWKQWNIDEIRSGAAWDVVRRVRFDA